VLRMPEIRSMDYSDRLRAFNASTSSSVLQ